MEQLINEKLEGNASRIKMLRDLIADLKKHQDELLEFEELYRSFFSLSDDVLLIFDSLLVVQMVSPNVERLIGYTPEELVGKTFQQLAIMEQNEKDDAVDIATHVLSQGIINNSFFTFITKSGEKRIAEISGCPIMRDNRPVGVIAVCKKLKE
jgi:PAS domain S-box-containing protein